MFKDFVNHLIDIEGGYVNDPLDSGGETNYGITKRVARKYGYYGDMRYLPREKAEEIYKIVFWDSLRLDEVSAYSDALAHEIADIAVNMGVSRVGHFFQRVLNVMNDRGRLYSDIVVDGLVGRRTIAAFEQYMSIRGHEGADVMRRAINALQGSFYINLAERREKDERFIYGWFKRVS